MLFENVRLAGVAVEVDRLSYTQAYCLSVLSFLIDRFTSCRSMKEFALNGTDKFFDNFPS